MNTTALPELVLVEDSPDDEALSLRAIKVAGIPCNVTVRRDGAEALDHLLSEASQPALIVLDYKLPKYSGREVLGKLRDLAKTRFTPIVIFSGTNTGELLTDCYVAGANSCVMKPNDPSQYVDRLAAVTRYWLSVNQPPEACFESNRPLGARSLN